MVDLPRQVHPEHHPFWTVNDMAGIRGGLEYLVGAIEWAAGLLERENEESVVLSEFRWVAESLRESCGDLDDLLARLKAQLEPMYKEDLRRQFQGGT